MVYNLRTFIYFVICLLSKKEILFEYLLFFLLLIVIVSSLWVNQCSQLSEYVSMWDKSCLLTQIIYIVEKQATEEYNELIYKEYFSGKYCCIQNVLYISILICSICFIFDYMHVNELCDDLVFQYKVLQQLQAIWLCVLNSNIDILSILFKKLNHTKQ